MDSVKECLLIDDDQDDQEIFQMCVGPDVHCTIYSDPVEALSMFLSDTEYIPDFIFIDLNMPKMSGIDCLKALKRIERLRQTKMFIYSTSSSGSMNEETKMIGAAGFIIKPVKLAELKIELAAIFNPGRPTDN